MDPMTCIQKTKSMYSEHSCKRKRSKENDTCAQRHFPSWSRDWLKKTPGKKLVMLKSFQAGGGGV